jgi:hypothetical protein
MKMHVAMLTAILVSFAQAGVRDDGTCRPARTLGRFRIF